MIDVIEFDTTYCIMKDLRILSSKKIIEITHSEDKGELQDYMIKTYMAKTENYLIICKN